MRTAVRITILIVLVFMSGCSDEVERYSIEQFMNTEQVLGGSFSADEKRILFTSDRTGVFNAFAMPVK